MAVTVTIMQPNIIREKKIMFTGDFTKMLNGDSAIMFGIYKGTDINDIPGFDAYFLEFHNGDF